MAIRTIRSTCRTCHGACDVLVHMGGDPVVKVTGDRIHAVVGGLHLPLTGSSGFCGLPMQRIVGTGLPPGRILDEDDLEEIVEALGRHRVERVLISAHDSCDRGIDLLETRSGLPVEILSTGNNSLILSAGAPRTSRNGVADLLARERAWNS